MPLELHAGPRVCRGLGSWLSVIPVPSRATVHSASFVPLIMPVRLAHTPRRMEGQPHGEDPHREMLCRVPGNVLRRVWAE